MRFCAFRVEDMDNKIQLLHCMESHVAELELPCRYFIQNATAKISAFHSACDMDLKVACPGVASDDLRGIRSCVIANLPSLGKGCLAEISKLAQDMERHHDDKWHDGSAMIGKHAVVSEKSQSEGDVSNVKAAGELSDFAPKSQTSSHHTPGPPLSVLEGNTNNEKTADKISKQDEVVVEVVDMLPEAGQSNLVEVLASGIGVAADLVPDLVKEEERSLQ